MRLLKKNAFTLIELLVVMVIVGSMSIIVSSAVTSPDSPIYRFAASTVAPALGVGSDWIGALAMALTLGGLVFVVAAVAAVTSIVSSITRRRPVR